MRHIKWKVCGMREIQNIQEVAALEPDFLGFIFYEKSKRFTSVVPKVTLAPNTKKAGVFVNESIEHIIEKTKTFSLDLIQLHGDENPEFCKNIKKLQPSIPISKAFGVDEKFDFDHLLPYHEFCDYFLFDTKGKDYGGNGISFDWHILKNYRLNKPVFISGGISPENIDELLLFIQNSSLPIYAIDVNSRFEIEPGLKNVESLKILKNKVSNQQDLQ